ncbi:MAG: RsmG family class I SAM-dependent methyltransferase [Mariprofundaceae bacterium]|nr:RsmG family class I SAM-dependent methyltransferase [Mariprofundaceae bacterium]
MSREALDRYCSEVLRFRRALNLTSIKSEKEFMARFVEPSVALARWMPETGRLLDIGSGMGVPGIPLLIARSALQGVLVERRKKRAEFLRHLVRVLRLNAEIYDADINALPHLGVNICVARAVTNIPELLKMCGRHTAPGAIAVLPVPQSAEPALVEGWRFDMSHTIEAGDAQKIHCYSCPA